MYLEKFKYNVMDKHLVNAYGQLEHWQVYLKPNGKLSYAYRVYINGQRMGEFTLDENARWVDLLFGFTDASENIGEMIEQYAE